MPRPPRPPLDETARNTVLRVIGLGASHLVAADCAGCEPGDIESTAARDPAFRKLLRAAERQPEVHALEQIHLQTKNWRAAAWLLERINPERYGKRKPRTLTADDMAEAFAHLRRSIDFVHGAANRKRIWDRFDLIAEQIWEPIDPPRAAVMAQRREGIQDNYRHWMDIEDGEGLDTPPVDAELAARRAAVDAANVDGASRRVESDAESKRRDTASTVDAASRRVESDAAATVPANPPPPPRRRLSAIELYLKGDQDEDENNYPDPVCDPDSSWCQRDDPHPMTPRRLPETIRKYGQPP